MKNKHTQAAKVFKTLCDPNRLMIVEMLNSGEKCACRLLENVHISQSTLSHHMKSLSESGVVNCRRDGKWMYYSLNKEGCEAAFGILAGIMEAPLISNTDEKCICE